MRLNDLTIRLRRSRAVNVDSTAPAHNLELGRRQSMSLESLNRAAHSRSLKSAPRAR